MAIKRVELKRIMIEKKVIMFIKKIVKKIVALAENATENLGFLPKATKKNRKNEEIFYSIFS